MSDDGKISPTTLDMMRRALHRAREENTRLTEENAQTSRLASGAMRVLHILATRAGGELRITKAEQASVLSNARIASENDPATGELVVRAVAPPQCSRDEDVG